LAAILDLFVSVARQTVGLVEQALDVAVEQEGADLAG
jgi:hypothetical protein